MTPNQRLSDIKKNYRRQGYDPFDLLSIAEEQAELIDRMQAALREYSKLYWPHNAGVTDDIETLRRSCLEHCDWWNNIALPLLESDCPVCGEDHEGHPPPECETGDGA